MEASNSGITLDLRSRMAQIGLAGNHPTDWKEFIDEVKSTPDPMDENRHLRSIDGLYKTAFKVIPSNCKSVFRAQLFIDYAQFRSVNFPNDSIREAEKVLSYAYRKLNQFAIVHVAYAELELKKGNKERALEILQQAPALGAKPISVINKAIQKFTEGRTKLLNSEETEDTCSHLSPVSSQDSSEEWSNTAFNRSFGTNKETMELNPPLSHKDLDKMKLDIENIPPSRLPYDVTPSTRDPDEAHNLRNPLSLTSYRSFNLLPDTPKPSIMPTVPGSEQKKLGQYHSTPNLLQSASKGSSAFMYKNLAPPQRVKVNKIVMKKLSEDNNSGTFEFSSGSVFSQPITSGKSDDTSPESMDQHTEGAVAVHTTSDEIKGSTGVISHRGSFPVLPLSKMFTQQEHEPKINIFGQKTFEVSSSNQHFDPLMSSIGKKSLDMSNLSQPTANILKSETTNKMLNRQDINKELSSSLKPVSCNLDIPYSSSTLVSMSSSSSQPQTITATDAIRRGHDSQPMVMQQSFTHKPIDAQRNIKETEQSSATYNVMNPSSHSNVAPAAYNYPPPVNKKVKYVNGVPYTVLCEVGRGGSAKVYQIFDPQSNGIRALKIVDLMSASSQVREGYLNEIRFLKKLQHCDRVIKLFDSEYDEARKKLYAVLEYGETDLDKMIGNCKETKQLDAFTIGHYWKQMVEAVHAMHQEGVIHSDLKPANFLLVSGKVKLIDFGIANSIQNDCTSIIKEERMGTPSYMSPESLMEVNGINQPAFKIGKKSDVWSLGCILYQMVYGHTPFQNLKMRLREKLHAIVSPSYIISFPDTGEPELLDVLKRCLTREVALRPTTDDILNHPYLKRRGNPQTDTCSFQNMEPALRLLREKLAGISPSKQELSLKKILDIVDGKNTGI